MVGAGEMAQWLRALAALSEDPGSIPNTHTADHNCGDSNSMEINTPTQTYVQTKH